MLKISHISYFEDDYWFCCSYLTFELLYLKTHYSLKGKWIKLKRQWSCRWRMSQTEVEHCTQLHSKDGNGQNMSLAREIHYPRFACDPKLLVTSRPHSRALFLNPRTPPLWLIHLNQCSVHFSERVVHGVDRG